MKKFLLAATALTIISGSALAADLAVRRAPPPAYAPRVVAPLYSWTGCYVGGNGGGIWAKTEWNDTRFGSFGDSTASGGLGGLQVGCNYQAGAWVFGVQGDYDWASAKTDNTNVFLTANFPGFGPIVNHTEIKSIASVTGRVGYALDRFLVYGKGGGAWVRADHSFLVGGATVASSSDSSRGGWTAGVGGEYAFNNWLTGFVEWDYYKFDNDNPNGLVCGPGGCGGVFFTNNVGVKETINVVKAGLNLKFGPGGFAFGY
jgi:outer membrane immunogenic protein